jgi:hypothetical protein
MCLQLREARGQAERHKVMAATAAEHAASLQAQVQQLQTSSQLSTPQRQLPAVAQNTPERVNNAAHTQPGGSGNKGAQQPSGLLQALDTAQDNAASSDVGARFQAGLRSLQERLAASQSASTAGHLSGTTNLCGAQTSPAAASVAAGRVSFAPHIAARSRPAATEDPNLPSRPAALVTAKPGIVDSAGQKQSGAGPASLSASGNLQSESREPRQSTGHGSDASAAHGGRAVDMSPLRDSDANAVTDLRENIRKLSQRISIAATSSRRRSVAPPSPAEAC